jgi:hypothetical protein
MQATWEHKFRRLQLNGPKKSPSGCWFLRVLLSFLNIIQGCPDRMGRK